MTVGKGGLAMGGKAKIFNPEKLKTIYLESRAFEKKANAALQRVQKLVNALNADDRGGVTRTVITNVGDAVNELRETLANTGRFIERKLDGAAQFSADRVAFSDSSRPSGRFPISIN